MDISVKWIGTWEEMDLATKALGQKRTELLATFFG